MNIQFGAGNLFGVVKTAGVLTGTPVKFGALQEVNLEFNASIKELFGQYQFPLAIGRGTAKVTGKAKFANIQYDALGALFFHETPAVGQTIVSVDEAHTIPGVSTYTVTVTNGATGVADYGVRHASTGLPFSKVTTPSGIGQYSCVPTTGVYTFDVADKSVAVLISYSYTVPATGHTITINNQLLGDAPVFQCVLQQTYNSKLYGVTLYNCVSTKLTLPTKLEDFEISDFDFGAFVNDAGVLGIASFPD